MANFKEAFHKVILAEGGYVNDPDDKGGETYLGITRVHHPKAKMWDIIDGIKKQYGLSGINNRLKAIPVIIEEAESIYKKQYWDKIRLDEVYSQKVAHQLFDHAVNAGVGPAINIAQVIVGMKVTSRISQDLIDKLKVYGKR